MKIRTRRLSAALAVVALPLAMLGLAPTANAAVLGKLKIGPSTGNQSTLFDMSTLSGKACPTGTSAAQAIVTGGTSPVLTDDNPGVITGPDDISHFAGPNGNVVMGAARQMSTVWSEVGVTAPAGVYTYKLQCLDDSFLIIGEFTNTVTWTATTGSGNGTYVASPTTTTTGTVLSTGTPDPVTAGTTTSLTATVTPADAAGTIRFKNGSTFLSSAITVAGGTATLATVTLPAGSNALSAVFTPTDAGSFGTSTGTKSYSVLGAPSITGTTRVGSAMTCATPAIAPAAALSSTGKAVLWLKNGVSTGITSNPVTAPSSWLNQNITCNVTVTKSAVNVNLTSVLKKVTIGAAPIASVKPKVLGTALVARTLTCSPGTWKPAATSYKHQWFRGTVKLAGKTLRTYRTVAADRTKLITCQVTAIRTGHLNGVAKAPARRIT